MTSWHITYKDADGEVYETDVIDAPLDTPLHKIDWKLCGWDISNILYCPSPVGRYINIWQDLSGDCFALDYGQLINKVEILQEEDPW